MKRILISGVFLLIFSSSLFSQSYRAQDYYTKEKQDFSGLTRWEISAGFKGSSGQVRDFFGQNLSQGEYGLEMRFLYSLTEWFSFGVEGMVSFPFKQDVSLDDYKTQSLTALVKLTFTPQSSPRAYLLLGMGEAYKEAQYFDSWKYTAQVSYLTFGWGIETDISGAWFGGLELRGIYNLDLRETDYFSFVRRWEGAVHLRTGIRF